MSHWNAQNPLNVLNRAQCTSIFIVQHIHSHTHTLSLSVVPSTVSSVVERSTSFSISVRKSITFLLSLLCYCIPPPTHTHLKSSHENNSTCGHEQSHGCSGSHYPILFESQKQVLDETSREFDEFVREYWSRASRTSNDQGRSVVVSKHYATVES